MGDREMILPCKSGDVELSAAYIAALRQAYPTKDIDTELARAHLWLVANPARRPVRWPAFLRNWLKRADDVIAPQPNVAGWWATEQRTMNQGAALGLAARPGESLAEYRGRISAKLAQGRAA
jgi:hypothetical protein